MAFEVLGKEFAARAFFVVEVVPAVLAADEHGLVADAAGLLHVRGDVADGETDPALGGPVRFRIVRDLTWWRRHFARLQHDVDDLLDIHFDRDLLAAREQVVLAPGLAMLDDAALMRARNHPHAAALDRARREGHPGGDDVGGLQSPVGRVLVPAHIGVRTRLLQEEIRAPYQDVRADEPFDEIENSRAAAEVGEVISRPSRSCAAGRPCAARAVVHRCARPPPDPPRLRPAS